MKTLPASVSLVLSIAAAHASMWTDPEFEEMIKDSPLIAVVEVEKDGKFVCPVKVVDALKGKAPDTFNITGYNDPQMEEEGIEAETLRKGDRLLVFLSPVDEKEEDAETGRTFTVPTPSCGDLRIKDGKIRGGCYLNTYPQQYPPIDATLVTELVRGAVIHRDGREPEAAKKLIRERLTAELVSGVTDNNTVENRISEWTAHWLLWAAGDYGGADPQVVLKAASSVSFAMQITAAKPLRRLPPDNRTLEAVSALLMSRHAYPQVEGVKALTALAFDRKQAVDALLKALPHSSSAARGPRNVMDPVLNKSASGRELMIRAVEHFEAATEAGEILTAMVAEDELSEGVFEALRGHFLAHPSNEARDRFLELFGRCPSTAAPLFLTYVAAEKSLESLAAISARLTKDDMEPRDLQVALETVGFKGLPEKFVLSLAKAVTQKHPKDEKVAQGAASLLTLNGTEQTLQAAADLILSGPLEDYELDQAVKYLALREKPACPNLRTVLSKVLSKQSRAKSKEPHANSTLCACIRVADRALLKQVEQAPARLFAKEMRTLAVAAMKLKMKPPADAAKEVTLWCELLAGDRKLGYATPFLAAELKRACGNAHRDHAIAELKRLIPDPGEEIKALIVELSGKPKPQ